MHFKMMNEYDVDWPLTTYTAPPAANWLRYSSA